MWNGTPLTAPSLSPRDVHGHDDVEVAVGAAGRAEDAGAGGTDDLQERLRGVSITSHVPSAVNWGGGEAATASTIAIRSAATESGQASKNSSAGRLPLGSSSGAAGRP
jgi:hypothetical protein